MKVNIHTKGVIITSKQKALMERQVLRLKRYVQDFSPVSVDVTLLDESSPNKGGIDQAVHINAILPNEKIFIEEVDDRLMRAFNFAVKTLERRFKRYAGKKIDKKRREASRFKSVINVFGGAARVVGGTVGRIVPKRKKKK